MVTRVMQAADLEVESHHCLDRKVSNRDRGLVSLLDLAAALRLGFLPGLADVGAHTTRPKMHAASISSQAVWGFPKP